MADNIEMKNLGDRKEDNQAAEEENAVEETDIGETDELLDDEEERLERIKQSMRKGGEDQEQLERLERLRDPNASIVVPQGLSPDIETEQEVRELEQKKDFLREYLNISVDESDGTNSATFLKNTELRVGKTGKIIGLRWR